MEIKNNSVILAPSSLHLPLYAEIYRQKGNCLNIQVISLESWIQSLLQKERIPVLQVLYRYAQALADLPEDNLFYQSRNDYDFLKDCYDFLSLAALYGIEEFPQESHREQSLKEILNRLQQVEIWQQEAAQIPFPDVSSLYILKTEYKEHQRYWIEMLLKAGAHELKENRLHRSYYWSVSNTRKMMEAAADAIIENNLNAEDIMVVLASAKDRRVFSQIFDSRKIPYTFLQEEESSKIPDQWKAVFRYLASPDEENLIQVLKKLYPAASVDLIRYRQLLPEDNDLQHLAWQDNSLIDQETFANLQALQLQCRTWNPVVETIKGWTLESIPDIAHLIQEQTPTPTPADLQAFDTIISAWQSVRDFLKKPEDLNLLVRSLDTLQASATLSSMKGVLVGSRNEISPLRPVVFYLGADATSFPGLSRHSGVFNETYLAKTAWPPLEERLASEQENLYEVLSQPETVYFVTPQSDYEGKPVEPSHDLNMWLGMLPKFQRVPESNINLKPKFSFDAHQTRSLYDKDGIVHTPLGSLDDYRDCPLKNLLHYGLHLQTPATTSDELKPKAGIVPRIMEKARRYHLPYWELDLEQIRQLIHEDFSFARQVYPHRLARIASLEDEYALRLARIFKFLAPVARDWNMDLVASDYRVSMQENVEDLNLEIEGSLSKNTAGRVSLNLYEKNNGTGFFELENAPKGTLNFSLQPKTTSREAFSISYGRGAAPARAVPLSEKDAQQEAEKTFYKDNMTAQDIGEQSDELGQYVSGKLKSYEGKQTEIAKKAQEFGKGLKDNRFDPEHRADVCTKCSYRSICRNAAYEKKGE